MTDHHVTLREILSAAERLERGRLHQLTFILQQHGAPIKGGFQFSPSGVFSAEVEMELESLLAQGAVSKVGEVILAPRQQPDEEVAA